MPLLINPKHISGSMTTDAELNAAVAGKVNSVNPSLSGSLSIDKTVTSAGVTGNRTINKPAGTVNFATNSTVLTVTNSLVTTDSIIYCVMRTDSLNATIWSVVCSNGAFTITLSGPPDEEVSVGFIVFN